MSRFFGKLPPGVRRLFRLPQSRSRLLREMDEEIAAHFGMRVDELRALGMSDREAESEARRRFGDAAEFRDYAGRRAVRRARWLDASRWASEFEQDARAAIRQFRRTPALNALVVVTLALTIGATTAVYGVVRHLLLAPLPYPDGNRIVSLEIRDKGDGTFRWDIGAEEYRLWLARSRTLEDFAGYTWGKTTIRASDVDGRAGDTVKVALVTPSFLPMLRIRPLLGRGITPEDARDDAPVALLSNSVWLERFSGDRDVLGKTIIVNGEVRKIVGVVPAGVGPPVTMNTDMRHEMPNETDTPAVVLPMTSKATDFSGFARLRKGVTSASASHELDELLHAFSDTSSLKGKRAEVRTAQDRLEPQQRTSVQVLFGAACGLLLIACADVAGLLLMRGWARRREFAIRQTLGAGRARLARQLLTESLLLAVPSGVLGVLVAWVGLRPQALGYYADVRLDPPILIWTAVVSVATVIVFGAGPALLAWERSLDDALRTGGTGNGTGRAAGRAHVGLVITQIALSLVFLAAAGVLGRSFVALVQTPVGYEPAGLLEVSAQRTPPPGKKAPRRLTSAERVTAVGTLRETIAATPGVTEIAIGTIPLTNIREGPISVEGPTGVRPVDIPVAAGTEVGPEYFRVARIPLVRGRTFDGGSTAANEVIINETLARHLWPDRDAIGARLRFGEDGWSTVVGVAQDLRMPGMRAAEFYRLQMYFPDIGDPRTAGKFIVRTRVDPAVLRPVLARAVERAGIGATLRDVTTAESTLEYAYRAPRFALTIFGAFAMLAVALAAVGLFGIVAVAVARRTREIGIRVALGAEPAALARTILRQTARLLLVGCVVGVLAALGVSRAFTTLVYGVSATDPFALVAAVVLLAVIALVAAALPVRRALRVDPTIALRAE